MRGYILDYSVQSNRGIISGDDNSRYDFNGVEWMDDEPPRRGMAVDFDAVGNHATAIYVAIGADRPYSYAGGVRAGYSKSKIAAGLLAIFLGWLGIHKFYLGYTGPGILLLLCGTIGWVFFLIPPIVASIIGLIEGIIYLTKDDDQFEREYVTERKSWF